MSSLSVCRNLLWRVSSGSSSLVSTSKVSRLLAGFDFLCDFLSLCLLRLVNFLGFRGRTYSADSLLLLDEELVLLVLVLLVKLLVLLELSEVEDTLGLLDVHRFRLFFLLSLDCSFRLNLIFIGSKVLRRSSSLFARFALLFVVKLTGPKTSIN